VVKYLPDEAIGRLRRAADAPDFSGTRYRVIEEIGRGGMGVVYRAEDSVLGRTVALKVMDDAATEREARIMASLEHPGIVPVHDAGVLPDGRAFYAMKLVEGTPLSSYAGALADRLRVFQKICEAVAFAHSRGVVHGDLKPDNIMIGSFGEALVMDWGVAALSGPGVIAGTKGFMAPEMTVSQAGDVYALGAILRALKQGHESRAALDAIVARATARVPADRYGSALELRDEVARYVDGERVLAHRESVGERAARLFARHRTAILLVAAYLAMRIALLVFMRR
jgi:tRNA A-37 threonylcarbamoyl transferase component Bud32